jgi:predicted phosphodiesterase
VSRLENAKRAISLRADGKSWTDIAGLLSCNERTIRRTVKRNLHLLTEQIHDPTEESADPIEPEPETKRSFPPNIGAPWTAVNEPVVLHAVPPPAPTVASVEKILIIPDTHVPFEDGAAFAVMMAAARIVRPDVVVFLGDFADFCSVSFHPRKLGQRGYTLQEEAAAVNARLDEIQALGAKRVVFIKGNHEFRLERFLAEKAPELFGLVDTAALFRLRERGWECVEYRDHLKIGKMHFTHDVGHAGIYAHRQSRMAYEGNVVLGHTHRMAMEVAGTSKGPAHVGISLGWLGDKRSIDYMHVAKAAQWVLGFGLAYHERATGNVHVVPVPIVDYRCVVEGNLVAPLAGTSVDKGAA